MDIKIDVIKVLFYLFSVTAVFGAGMVVFSRNPVRAVLSLVLTFVAMAGVWMLLQSEFLALTLILVYVGAVMVLFLFVVMMLNMNIAPFTEGFARYLPMGLLLAVCLMGQIIWLFGKDAVMKTLDVLPVMPMDYSNITVLGKALYSEYVYPFEVAGIILTVAIIAAIGLTARGPRERKSQDIGKQIRTTKSERLTVLKDITPESALREVK